MAEHTDESAGATPGSAPREVKAGAAKLAPKDAIIEALMELAGERTWDDITITDVATRANLSLADFRDAFPSKGAVLAAFSRKIDRVVLDGTTDDLMGEPAKERLFDVLMRRLDALAPYKLGLEGIFEWIQRAPMAAASVNRLELNSMRFMLEAAGIDSEGAGRRRQAAGPRRAVDARVAELVPRRRSGPGADHGAARHAADPGRQVRLARRGRQSPRLAAVLARPRHVRAPPRLPARDPPNRERRRRGDGVLASGVVRGVQSLRRP